MTTARAATINDSVDQTTGAMLQSLSSSYGPKGLDKMIVTDKETIITNDGATILKHYKTNPIHRIIGGVSHSQDVNCGDGTTSVVLLVGALMEKLCSLKRRGIHPSRLSKTLESIKRVALEYIERVQVKIGNEEYLNVALTTLSSKIAAKSVNMAKTAINALKVSEKSKIRMHRDIGGNVDDIELVGGFLIRLPASEGKYELPDGITETQKLLLIQFCLSAPKTAMDSKVLISDYTLMERFVREERNYVIKLVKAIKKSGATLILIQKSILRESCSELAKHILKKAGIKYVDGIDRKEMEDLASELGVRAVSDVDLITEPLEVKVSTRERFLEIKGVGCSIVVRGCDQMVAEEAERSLNDALCVVDGLMKEPYVVPGGGSIETGIAVALEGFTGSDSMLVHEIAECFLKLPLFLAQNAGLYAVEVVAQLKRNIQENPNLGISLRTGYISDMVNDDGVIQPVIVSRSSVVLALETAQMLVKIDDILPSRY